MKRDENKEHPIPTISGTLDSKLSSFSVLALKAHSSIPRQRGQSTHSLCPGFRPLKQLQVWYARDKDLRVALGASSETFFGSAAIPLVTR